MDTLDYFAEWVDCFGNTYGQKIKLTADQDAREALSGHFAWVLTHHAIASYSITATN